MKAMLCGSSDLKDLLGLIAKPLKEMGIELLTFLDGTINYENYGEDKWIDNSKMTVQNSDIMLFIVHKQYGKITWNTEYKEAIKLGKNFIVLCHQDTYTLYRQIKDLKILDIDTLEHDKAELLRLLNALELNQLTIIPYTIDTLEQKLKNQLLLFFDHGLSLLEKENRKSSLLPILRSSGYREKLRQLDNDIYHSIAHSLLMDVFEIKEHRKRALDYFINNKKLTEDDIFELINDPEQGVARKTIRTLPELISESHDKERIFRAIIDNCTEDDVGIVRRGIVAMFSIDFKLAVFYLPDIFPVHDVGTPRRIIQQIDDKWDEIHREALGDEAFKNRLMKLISHCLDFKTEGQEWKNRGKDLLGRLQ